MLALRRGCLGCVQTAGKESARDFGTGSHRLRGRRRRRLREQGFMRRVDPSALGVAQRPGETAGVGDGVVVSPRRNALKERVARIEAPSNRRNQGQNACRSRPRPRARRLRPHAERASSNARSGASSSAESRRSSASRNRATACNTGVSAPISVSSSARHEETDRASVPSARPYNTSSRSRAAVEPSIAGTIVATRVGCTQHIEPTTPHEGTAPVEHGGRVGGRDEGELGNRCRYAQRDRRFTGFDPYACERLANEPPARERAGEFQVGGFVRVAFGLDRHIVVDEPTRGTAEQRTCKLGLVVTQPGPQELTEERMNLIAARRIAPLRHENTAAFELGETRVGVGISRKFVSETRWSVPARCTFGAGTVASPSGRLLSTSCNR